MPNIHVAVKFEGGIAIPGAVNETNHNDGTWVKVKSITTGISREIPTGKVGEDRKNGECVCQPIVLTRAYDKSSPALWDACANNSKAHFTTVTIDFYDFGTTGNPSHLKRTLTNVIVKSCSFFATATTADTSEFANEEIALDFEKEVIDFADTEGTSDATWNPQNI